MVVSSGEVEQGPTLLPRVFDPRKHLTDIKTNQGNKEYLPVQWRLVWFRSVCPEGTIETEMIHLDMDEYEAEVFVWNPDKRRTEKVMKRDRGMAIFRAVVKDGKGGIATGSKSEKAAAFDDFVEKAETGAIGRALAALGYGTQFTGEEWDEAHRIVDSPVDKDPTPSDLAKQAQEDLANLRARVEEIKPKNKQGMMSFEQFYTSSTKKPYKGDRNVSVEDRKLCHAQLDVIVRMRANPAEQNAVQLEA